MSEENKTEDRSGAKWTSLGVKSFAVFSAAVLVIGELLFLQSLFSVQNWQDVLQSHIGAIAGLQIAAAVAFCLVVFLRQTEGQIKFSGLGFYFEGASGQIVMWVVCFLAIAGAIKLLW